MDSLIKKISNKDIDEKVRSQFLRFGKGNYRRRFLISYNKVKDKIKIKSSFEFANDFVNFIKENKEINFSGKILTKEEVPGKGGKKKAGSFVYEISNSSIKEFGNAYFYLLDANSEDIVLKIKKSLPKPGKDADKIDDKFCSLEIDQKYWAKFKEAFFWDIPEAKKVKIAHEVVITDIEIPKDEPDPMKMREKAIRKGKLVKSIEVDGHTSEKEVPFAV